MSLLGLSFDKLLVVGFIAVLLLGPTKLPGYAHKLAQLVKTVRTMADGAKERMRDEMGSDFDDVDWQKLDPRQYDPRRIIRDALLDDDRPAIMTPATAAAVAEGLPNRMRTVVAPLAVGEAPPYDTEAT